MIKEKSIVSASEHVGVKELQEVIQATLELALKLSVIFKDGFQIEDIEKVLDIFTKDEEMRKMLVDAYTGVAKVGDEIKDLDAAEGIALAMGLVQYVPRFIAIFKK